MLTMRASISKDVFPNLIQFNKNIISKDSFDKIIHMYIIATRK